MGTLRRTTLPALAATLAAAAGLTACSSHTAPAAAVVTAPTTEATTTVAPPTHTTSPYQKECEDIVLANNKFENATRNALPPNDLLAAQKAYDAAVSNRPDQPAKVLAVAVALLAVDTNLAALESRFGDSISPDKITKIQADVADISTKYDAFWNATCR